MGYCNNFIFLLLLLLPIDKLTLRVSLWGIFVILFLLLLLVFLEYHISRTNPFIIALCPTGDKEERKAIVKVYHGKLYYI